MDDYIIIPAFYRYNIVHDREGPPPAMESAMKKILHIFIGIIITGLFLIFLGAELCDSDSPGVSFLRRIPFEMIEAKLLDFRFLVRGPLKPPANVVIAAIDEESIQRLGRFPWSRDKIAGIVNKLAASGTELIMFDILLAEPEDHDNELANAMRDAGNVILPVSFALDKTVDIKNNAIGARSILMPVKALSAEAMGLGHINMLADRDGTLRWETTAIGYEGKVIQSIDLQTAALHMGVPPEGIDITSINGIQLGRKRFIPTNRHGQFLINYYGRTNTFRHISISDIVDDKVSPKDLQGRIVLVGATTAKGLFDLRVTPFTAEMPGIEKHASVISSIIEDRLLRKASPVTDLGILIFSGLLFSLLVVRFRALGASIITAGGLLLIALLGYYFFAVRNIWLNITFPALNMLSIFVILTAYSYAVEEKYARQIRAMFSSYATERLVDALIKNPEMAKLGGENREVTILFSDVRGFTTFSEKYAPEEVVAILNEYLGVMTGVVFRWEGTLDKFIGDAILAFWGAPLKQENHAELAVKCAIDMMNKLHELQGKWEAEGKAGLDIGIGINTGEVIVGNIGAEGKKMDYTVIGDHVNLGSRVESLTRKYNCHILITEYTLDKIRDVIKSGVIGHVSVTGHEMVIVKGKEQPVGIYEITDLNPGAESCVIERNEEKIVRMKEK